MTIDFEPHREVLQGLYLRDNKSLAEIKKQLADHYGFTATKAQYEAQFKKWNWRKYLRESEWKYVSRKFGQRKRQDAGKESAVYLNGSRIPSEKVKKEISRHVRPSDAYYLQAIPQSPEGVIVCTPPAENMTSPPRIMTGMTSAKRKHSYEELSQETFRNMRRQTMTPVRDATSDIATTVEDVRIVDVVSTPPFSRDGISSEISIVSRRRWIAPGAIDLDELPFFQFRRFMRSPDIVNGFEKMVAVHDALGGRLVPNYWPQPSPLQQSDSYLYSLEANSIVYSDINNAFESYNADLPMQNNPLPVCKPLGTELLYMRGSVMVRDILECTQTTQEILLALLASMPQIPGDDVQQNIDLLLGPPTIESCRYAVEVGVYLSSNFGTDYDHFISWMLRIFPWTILKRILSIPVLVIQAFAESVLKIATRMENIQIVTDLLQNPRLTSLIRSSDEVLVGAVETSNAALVRLLLRAGAKADQVVAKTVEIARMLVEAGADVNAIITKYCHTSSGFGLCPSGHTALCAAVGRNDVNLARYLINAGANVNLPSKYCSSLLASAAYFNYTELVELLLDQGAPVNQVVRLEFHRAKQTALQLAAHAGHLDCVRLLVEAGGDVNAPADHHDGWTALQAACLRGHIEMVTFLLNRGAHVNDPGNFDHRFPQTVLTTAVEENHLKLVKLLLDAGADVHMPSFGYYGCSALEAAKSRPASADIVNLLIAKGARDHALPSDPHRMIELFEAVGKQDLARVRFLTNLGVPIDMRLIEGYDNETILHWALIKHGARTNIELFRFLVDQIEDVNAQNENPDVEPILIFAATRTRIEAVEILVGAGAHVNVSHREHSTPLIAAISSGDCEMVHFLLSEGADIHAIAEGNYVTTALQASLWAGDRDLFYFLLAKGARIHGPIGHNGDRDLVCAARTRSIQVVRELLDRGAEVNSPPGSESETPLQAAVSMEFMAMVQLLLEKGADVNAPATKHNSTPLSKAIFHGNFPLVLLLLEAGADINAPKFKCSDDTALGTAARWGRLDILYLLLKAGADMHLPVEERYVSATRLAREKGHIVIAEILEGWDKNGSAQNSKGKERLMELD